jgi:hypothetical protein
MGLTAISAEGSSRTHGHGHRARKCGAPATATVPDKFPPGAAGATVRAWPAVRFARQQADLGVPGRRPGQCRGRDVALYVDDAIWRWQGLQWAHLLADSVDELHRFAADLGINRLSYQGPPRTSVPHYDLTAYERRRAIARGAIACSRHEIVVVLRRARSEDRLARMIETRGVVALELARRPPLDGELKM